MDTTITTRTSLVVALALLAGCSAVKERDVLEARLRDQEDMLASYQSQLDRVKTELDVAKREAGQLRTQLTHGETSPAGRNDPGAAARVEGIEFSSLMTGGLNRDMEPGDDGLSVVLAPHDHQGELVRAAGSFEIEAFDLAASDGARKIGRWRIDLADSQNHWHQGVIQSGYRFELPWQELPSSDKLLLHGRMISSDQRQFDATATVRITPPGAGVARGDSASRPNAGIQQVSVGVDSQMSDARSSTLDRPRDGSGLSDRDNPFAAPPLPGGDPPALPTGVGLGHSAPTGRGRPPEAAALTGDQFSSRLNISSPLSVESPSPPPGRASIGRPRSSRSVGPAAAPAPSTQGGRPAPPASGASPWPASTEIPPEIQDWPVESDWHSEPAPGTSGTSETRSPVQTSDWWNDESIPYRR